MTRVEPMENSHGPGTLMGRDRIVSAVDNTLAEAAATGETARIDLAHSARADGGRRPLRARLEMPMIDLLSRLDRGSASRLPVLMYHRVAEEADPTLLDPRLLSATPGAFEEQIAYLNRTRTVMSLDELVAVRRGEAALPTDAVLITFDDAYADFGEIAWPILQAHGVPVTLFVPTAYPGSGRTFWWDRLHHALASLPLPAHIETPAGPAVLREPSDRTRCVRRITTWARHTPDVTAMAAIDALVSEIGASAPPSPMLGWPELRRLAQSGVALAPHSRTHPMLNQMPLKEAQAEILGSVADLRREVGASPPVFSLPAGGHSEELLEWLASAEFDIVFTTTRGNNDLRTINWHRMRRINVGRRTAPATLGMQFLSYFPQRSRFENAEPLSSHA